MNKRAELMLAAATAGLLLALLAWDASGLDMALARLAGDRAGFALREHWFLSGVMHEGARRLSWVVALLLCLGAWWPVGPLARLDLARRIQLAGGTLAAVAVVALLKSASATSCPWDLSDFGGLAHRMPHWLGFLHPDGGGGHCFPAGHAASGFAFVGGYFAFREQAPQVARRWLVASLLAGLVLGLAQQWRGAHFMSHTLWTGLACWLVAWAADHTRHRVQRAARARDAGPR